MGLVEKKISEITSFEELKKLEGEIETRRKVLEIMEVDEEIDKIKDFFKIGRRIAKKDINNIKAGDKFWYLDLTTNQIGLIQIEECTIHHKINSVEKFFKYSCIKSSYFNNYRLVYGPMIHLVPYYYQQILTNKEDILLKLPLYFFENDQKKSLFSKST